MITGVKLSGPGTTVGEVRALFEDGHVQCAVVLSGTRLMAVVDRADIQEAAPGDLAAAAGGRDGRVVTADTPLGEARELLLRTGRRRLAVVGPDGTFLGLLCLKRTRRGFCSDTDVQARSAAC